MGILYLIAPALLAGILISSCFTTEKKPESEKPHTMTLPSISISGGALDKAIARCDKRNGVRRLYLSPERMVKCKDDKIYYSGKERP